METKKRWGMAITLAILAALLCGWLAVVQLRSWVRLRKEVAQMDAFLKPLYPPERIDRNLYRGLAAALSAPILLLLAAGFSRRKEAWIVPLDLLCIFLVGALWSAALLATKDWINGALASLVALIALVQYAQSRVTRDSAAPSTPP